ncbi:hypothetical protein COY71_03305, partial [Candidatus Micrarchaeota archaeon CG_4_10_14_0_8_um_filter_60_7]
AEAASAKGASVHRASSSSIKGAGSGARASLAGAASVSASALAKDASGDSAATASLKRAVAVVFAGTHKSVTTASQRMLL